MLIGHLPAGYVCTRFLLDRSKTHIPAIDYKTYLRVGLVASILPDFDVIYYYFRYYLYGQWRPGHHAYWTHMPFYWLLIFTILLLFGQLSKRQKFVLTTYLGGVNLLLHFLLDSITNTIKWLYPLSNKAFGIFEVTLRYQWWVWDLVFNWSFCLELVLAVTAISVLTRDTFRLPANIRIIS